MGIVLFGLGGLLLAVAVLAVAWAPGVAKKTPLDVDTRTVYEGQAAKLDAATNAFDTKPVYAIQSTRADADKSSSDHVLFVEIDCLVVDTGGAKNCVNGNDPDLLDASVDIFATDRKTAMAVDDKNLPSDAGDHQGLINKWPFDVQKKTYPYWDGTVGHTVDMKYQGTEKIDGLTTYKFQSVVSDEETEIADGVNGTYSNTVTVNIDPKTGAIVKGAQDQQRFLDDGTPALKMSIVWDAPTVKDAVDEARSNGRMLTLLLTVLPIVGFVAGALCLLGGLLLMRREGERGRRIADRKEEKVGAGV